MTRERFLQVYSNLPINVRKEIILVIKGGDGKETPISWNVAYIEIMNRTKLGETILKKLIQLEII